MTSCLRPLDFAYLRTIAAELSPSTSLSCEMDSSLVIFWGALDAPEVMVYQSRDILRRFSLLPKGNHFPRKCFQVGLEHFTREICKMGTSEPSKILMSGNEAIARGAQVRHWSMITQGTGISFENFKAEFDAAMKHMSEKDKH